eukprot:184175-Prorocentrum_lima.AAC.1
MVSEIWGQLAGRDLAAAATDRLHMPTRLGGCGIANARSRRAAAPWCSRGRTLPSIAADARYNT